MAKYRLLITAFALWAFAVCSLPGDVIIMQNGDRYNGRVVSMTTNTLVLQSEMLGTINLSRSKIAGIAFGTNVVAISSQDAPNSATLIQKKSATTSGVSGQLRQLAAQTNLIQQVQGEFLSTATPEANAKFNQMVTDLSTGKMSISDLRAQAKDAADQLRELEKDSGDDTSSGIFDMYLSILDNFLNETTPAITKTTNMAPAILRKQ